MLFSCHLQVSSRLLDKWSLEDHPVATVVHPNGLAIQMLLPMERNKRVPHGRKFLFHDTFLGEHHYKEMLIISCRSELLLKGVAPKYSSPSATSHFQQLFSASLTTLLGHDPQEEADPAENLSQKGKKKVTIHHAGTKWLVLTGTRWPLSWGRSQDRLNFCLAVTFILTFIWVPARIWEESPRVM